MNEETLADKCYTIEAPELKISGIVFDEKDVKEFIKKDVLENLDFVSVKAGDLPKDMKVTAIQDVINGVERIKSRVGEGLLK